MLGDFGYHGGAVHTAGRIGCAVPTDEYAASAVREVAFASSDFSDPTAVLGFQLGGCNLGNGFIPQIAAWQ